jgi:hypothetical protein
MLRLSCYCSLRVAHSKPDLACLPCPSPASMHSAPRDSHLAQRRLLVLGLSKRPSTRNATLTSLHLESNNNTSALMARGRSLGPRQERDTHGLRLRRRRPGNTATSTTSATILFCSTTRRSNLALHGNSIRAPRPRRLTACKPTHPTKPRPRVCCSCSERRDAHRASFGLALLDLPARLGTARLVRPVHRASVVLLLASPHVGSLAHQV